MGAPWGFGNRDQTSSMTGLVGRAKRCVTNSVEAMVMFAPLVLVAVAAGKTNGLSAIGAQLFFYSRIGYVVAYVAGIPYLRTELWAGGLVGTVLVLCSCFG